MPHVIVKLWPGKSEEQKTRLAERITKDVMDVLKYGEEFYFCIAGRSKAAGLGRESLQAGDFLRNRRTSTRNLVTTRRKYEERAASSKGRRRTISTRPMKRS